MASAGSRSELARNSPLTFGIELEGMATPRQGTPVTADPYFELQDMANVLSGYGIACSAAPGAVPRDLWVVSDDFSIVEEEGTFPFELKSRVLHCTHDSSSKDFDEIAAVLSSLKRHYQVEANRTCGLHVHVGFGSLGLPLRTLQNFYAMVSGFEAFLAMIHPEARQHWSATSCFPTDSFYCHGPAMSGSMKRKPVYERVKAILNTRTYGELLEIFGHSRDTAYNLEGAVPYDDQGYRTVELRQAAGTFDFEVIRRWVKACIALVRYAHFCTDEELMVLFLSMSSCRTVVDLFNTMGFEEVAASFKDHLYPLTAYIEVAREDFDSQTEILDILRARPENMARFESELARARVVSVEQETMAAIEMRQRLDPHQLWVPYRSHPYSGPMQVIPVPREVDKDSDMTDS